MSNYYGFSFFSNFFKNTFWTDVASVKKSESANTGFKPKLITGVVVA